MYVPPDFEEANIETIHNLIKSFPLATIIAQLNDDILVNHLPVLLSSDKCSLIGHVALENEFHKAKLQNENVLAIFHGQDSYISPNWYPSKQQHHKHVPTWNYQVVHIRGKIHFSYDIKAKMACVGQLTKSFETQENEDRAWRMADAPRDYLNNQLENIVAFEIDINKILAKSKLSQNRATEDFENVIQKLDDKGKAYMTEEMIKLSSKNLKE